MRSKRSKAWHRNKRKEKILCALAGEPQRRLGDLPDGAYDAEIVDYENLKGNAVMTLQIRGNYYRVPDFFPGDKKELHGKFKVVISQNAKS